MSATFVGLGDSLMCGLEGYDLRPEVSFFARLAGSAGQEVRPPRLRWNIGGFVEACSWPGGSASLEQTLGVLRAGRIGIRVEEAPDVDGPLFAVPGFSLGAFLHWHEKTPGLPRHLELLAQAFLNPRGEKPATALQRMLRAGPSEVCIVWLGGVDWITCTLSEQRRCNAVARALLRQYKVLLDRLAEAPGRPLPVVGGAIQALRLPLTRAAPGGGRVMAFKAEAQSTHACDRIPVEDCEALARGVRTFNQGLQDLVESRGGIFVDLDARFEETLRRGYIADGDVRIPANDLVGLDLVHPSATGHAAIAQWFSDAIEAKTGERLKLPCLQGVWVEDLTSRPPVDRTSWRLVMSAIYERYLYKPVSVPEGVAARRKEWLLGRDLNPRPIG